MYLSLDWLKDYVDIPKSVSPEDLGLLLTLHTVEIDEVIDQKKQFENIVVGKVLEVVKHPDADRLNITKVDVGGKEALNIVCGAPNVKKGQFVPVAMVGAVLPGDFKIEEREVRGVKSFGMICAPDELGVGDSHDGIMVLDKKAKIGKPFSEYLKLNDILFDVDNKSITNRPDLWGHFGMAREVSVFLETKLTKKYAQIAEARLENDESLVRLNVEVADKNLCPRYTAVKVSGVEVKESPEWICKRLSAVGMRPINNIVDATNYVMLELGQPMHAFDAKEVSEIVVRRAKKEETIKTLDGQDRKLDDTMLVIADKKRALALAGIMGGENSEIKDDTDSIILESANFDFFNVRKTSSKFGLRTESSQRFEKSLDPNMCKQALARCVEMLKETCPNIKIDSQITDENNSSLNQGPIELDLKWLNKRIGENIEEGRVKQILEGLGFSLDDKGDGVFDVTVPTHRATKDINIKEDLLEEVARIYGYSNLKPQMPMVSIKTPVENLERQLERRVKDILSLGSALNEVYNYSFVSDEKLNKMKADESGYIRLANSVSGASTMLRQNLVFNLIDNIKLNQARFEEIGIFEIGNIFIDTAGTITKEVGQKDNLPFQEKNLGIVQAGDRKDDVYLKVKGDLEYLMSNFNLKVRYEAIDNKPEWGDDSFARVIVGGEDIGFVSKLDKKVVNSFGIKKEVAAVEISFTRLFNIFASLRDMEYQEVDKYPKAVRDLAFVIPSKVLYNDIKVEIENFHEFIKEVELFDVYQGDNLDKGKKSLAFHISYLSADRTLKSEEIDIIVKKMVASLEKKFDAKIRNF